MAQPAAARLAYEGRKVQTHQTAGTHRLTKTNSNGTGRAEEAATPGPGAVTTTVSKREG